MTSEEKMAGVSPCYVCGRTCTWNPATAAVVNVDPATGVPPDVEGSDPGAETVQRVVCPACVRQANALRREAGTSVLWNDPTDDEVATLHWR